PGSAFTGIHTLYVSPLKALAIDIERNLTKPVEEIGLPVTVENLTVDTPNANRQRQKQGDLFRRRQQNVRRVELLSAGGADHPP
ncbi:hypothetical protein ACC754_40580, partial [Rhizobium johnstonii]